MEGWVWGGAFPWSCWDTSASVSNPSTLTVSKWGLDRAESWSVGAVSVEKKYFYVSVGKITQGQYNSAERGWSFWGMYGVSRYPLHEGICAFPAFSRKFWLPKHLGEPPGKQSVLRGARILQPVLFSSLGHRFFYTYSLPSVFHPEAPTWALLTFRTMSPHRKYLLCQLPSLTDILL